MSDTKRVILGSELNDDRKITLDELGTKIALPVSLYNNSGTQINLSTGLGIPTHDYISISYDSSTQETYTFKSGGASGTIVATVVIIYTSSTKENISTVTKT